MEEESELIHMRKPATAVTQTAEEQETREEENVRPKSKLDEIGEVLYKVFCIVEHYVHALLSVVVAGFVIYYTNFFYNLFFNPYVDQRYFVLFLIFFTICTGLVLYVSFYLPIKKEEREAEEITNKIIPYLSILGIACVLSLINSIWLLYRYYSILIVISLSWGLIMSANFAPNGILGNIFCLGLFFFAVFSFKLIKHEGHCYVH